MIWEIILDALLDGLKVVPIVFIAYVIIEYIEARESVHKKFVSLFGGRFSPLFGAAIGTVPQCGFSVVATKLYEGGYILVGTLISVYIATSDEAIPVLFSRAVETPALWKDVAIILVVKFIYAAAAGFMLNLAFKRVKKKTDREPSVLHDEPFDHDGHNDCPTEGGKSAIVKRLILHPLLHTIKIFAYIFIINLALSLVIECAIGEARFEAFLSSSMAFQPLFAGLVGLIPNCASSVFISELFADNLLSLGGAIAGFTANCGLGLAVLFKDGSHVKRNAAIALGMLLLAVILGYIVNVITLLIR